LLANARFWPTIAPYANVQLSKWEQRAAAIEDPALRALALGKLSEERFNAEVAATLTTLVPRAHRETVIEAIVAYEVMYDYLDGLTELPTYDALRSGRASYRAFTDAVALDAQPAHNYYAAHKRQDDSGYLAELVRVVREALAQLPATPAIAETAAHAAARCAAAQTRAHAVSQLGAPQLEAWASCEAADSQLGWQQFLAGSASSVLAVHALIAAAADERTTAADAAELDAVYLSICALSTMLDSLIDYERDAEAGQEGYVRYYAEQDHLARDLAGSASRAVARAAPLRGGAHHVMTLVGVAAYYLSAPTAASDFARPVARQIRRELQPLMTPTLAVMRAWRLAKRIRAAIPRESLGYGG
jgi:tetraprenyl-beta-curcumene synthase